MAQVLTKSLAVLPAGRLTPEPQNPHYFCLMILHLLYLGLQVLNLLLQYRGLIFRNVFHSN